MTYPWNAGEVLAAADLNAEFASKLDLAGGKILQIVRATDTTNRSTTSTTFVDVTGMSVTITPSKSDSAIIIIAVASVGSYGSVDSQSVEFRITDSSNNAISGASRNTLSILNYNGTSTREHYATQTFIAYATPATTSATTYKLQFKTTSASVTATAINSNNSAGQMYAIEVSA